MKELMLQFLMLISKENELALLLTSKKFLCLKYSFFYKLLVVICTISKNQDYISIFFFS